MVFPLHYKPIKKSLRERILYDSRITDVYKVRNKMQRQAVFNVEMNMYVWVNESIISIWGYINRPMKSAQAILYIFKLVFYFWWYARYNLTLSLLVLSLPNKTLTTYLITSPRFFYNDTIPWIPGKYLIKWLSKWKQRKHCWYGNQITWWYVELWNHIEVSLRICFEWPCNFFR